MLLAAISAIVFLGATANLALAAEWRSQLTPAKPGHSAAFRPLTLHYRFGWEAISAAEATLRMSRPRPGIMKIGVDGRSTGWVRTLWRMDAKGFVLADASTLRPIRLRQAEWYRGGTGLTALEFTPSEVRHAKGGVPKNPPSDFFSEAPADDAKLKALTTAKPKHFVFPNLFDLSTALQFVRSMPLANGDVIRLVAYPASSAYLATIKVAGREKISVPAGEYNAIKVELSLQRINDTLGLEPHKKFKHATGWISDDESRLPLKLVADVFVGSVWTELDKVSKP